MSVLHIDFFAFPMSVCLSVCVSVLITCTTYDYIIAVLYVITVIGKASKKLLDQGALSCLALPGQRRSGR